MSRDSVAILIDGERQSSQVIFGALGRLPSGDLERVEILRGSSAEFGGSASVTVNLVMKKTLPKRSTEMRVALTTSVDSTVSTDNEWNSAMRWDQPFGMNLVSVGAEYIKLIRDDQQSFSGTETKYASSTRDGILWVQDDWTPQSSCTVTTGLRMESIALRSEAISKLRTTWLPSVAVRCAMQLFWGYNASCTHAPCRQRQRKKRTNIIWRIPLFLVGRPKKPATSDLQGWQ
jgi:outer membrane receptor for ferrienterochelin and colicin